MSMAAGVPGDSEARKMKVVVLIPSRLNSSRLPGKALLEIGSVPMVARVMLQAKKCKEVDEVYVCTDSSKIAEVAEKYGGKSIITSSSHENGTTRIAEAKKKLPPYDIYIDVQGDEPFIDPSHISSVIDCFKKYKPDIVLPLIHLKEPSSSVVKVVKDLNGRALYLSRAEIPYKFNNQDCSFLKHLSIIAFKPEALDRFAKLEISPLEKVEGVELLRALENGMYIQTLLLSGDSFSVDTQEDYDKAILKSFAHPLN